MLDCHTKIILNNFLLIVLQDTPLLLVVRTIRLPRLLLGPRVSLPSETLLHFGFSNILSLRHL